MCRRLSTVNAMHCKSLASMFLKKWRLHQSQNEKNIFSPSMALPSMAGITSTRMMVSMVSTTLFACKFHIRSFLILKCHTHNLRYCPVSYCIIIWCDIITSSFLFYVYSTVQYCPVWYDYACMWYGIVQYTWPLVRHLPVAYSLLALHTSNSFFQ